MSILSSESGKKNRIIFGYEKPKTYLNLIQKVGTEGKYQKQMLMVFSLNWFITGAILLSNIFLFRNRLYDCQQKGLLLSDQQCQNYICSLPESEWNEYFAPGHNDFKNIATLNNYQCEDSLPSIIASACTYVGAALGFLVVTFLADNYGRKLSLLISWGVCTVGCLVVVFDSNIYIVAVGLFLSGFGSDSSNNLTFLFFCQTLSNETRQQYSIIVQIFFTLGALVGTTSFYLINDWRIVWSVLVVFPALIYFFLIFCYIEQTPHFLLKKGSKYALDALNRIGMINLDRRQTLEEQDIQNVIDQQMIENFKGVLITHIDLCKFDSLRIKAIVCSLIAFAIYGMYFGPALIASKIGMSIYTSSYIVISSELIVFVPTYVFIKKIQRRQFGIILIGISVFCALLFILIEDPTMCGLCLDSNFQIFLLILFRAAVSFFFCFFQIYICEIFPSRVRGLSYGIISTIGSLSSTFTPILMSYFINVSINPMILFTVTGSIAIGGLILLPETMGVPLHEQIDQIERYKKDLNDRKKSVSKREYASDYHTGKKFSSNRMIQSQRW